MPHILSSEQTHIQRLAHPIIMSFLFVYCFRLSLFLPETCAWVDAPFQRSWVIPKLYYKKTSLVILNHPNFFFISCQFIYIHKPLLICRFPLSSIYTCVASLKQEGLWKTTEVSFAPTLLIQHPCFVWCGEWWHGKIPSAPLKLTFRVHPSPLSNNAEWRGSTTLRFSNQMETKIKC